MHAQVTEWMRYRHGWYRRIGDTMECRTMGPKTIPAGFIPAAPAHILTSTLNGVEHHLIRVRIKGWEAKKIYAVDSRGKR